ncbi:hypothetical protein HDU81_004949 [Chytriomyces hyalinus]|nr:hypothetical protein HDU81_004949 [Chytriomyces hyalinus]
MIQNATTESFNRQTLTKIKTEPARIAGPVVDFPTQIGAMAVLTKKVRRVLVRENEYSLYSHVPRVLTHALAVASHFKPPVFTGPKPSFFPCPDLEVISTPKYYEASNNKVDKPLDHSETHFHTFKGPVKQMATPKQAVNTEQPAGHYKKPKKLSRGQKLAAASKRAKAESELEPKRT